MVKSKNRLFGDIATNVDATTGRIDSASLDSDIATTDTSSNFASGLQSGGVNVAADANLNSFLTAFNLPTSDGSAGQYLKTDGSGTIGLESLPSNATTSADGFMSSSDKTKLDGVEAGATADQTNAEIRAAVEAASDSNVFTDADHTKLNGIEDNATADQTNDEIRAAVEAATDSNVFTDADHTKLNGIETAADVTDATNVAAAGAVMESDTTTANMAFVVDEDNMSSDSDTKLPTQQSVKAYVDTQLATKDALSELSGDSDDITQGSTNLFMTTAERSKLTGIETGATADQTDAEIKTAYENNSDTNALTDALLSKLNGIESSATADQTASEILTAIKTVDGASSGLDADLLDGNEATHFLNTSTSFGGDVSGTYNAIVIADDSHNHTISNIDDLQTTLDAKLALAGGTMAGSLVLHADPTASLQAATKQYVDTIASAGLHYHQPVRVEHPSNLNATYNNGSSGVGATLTNAGSNAAIQLDGVNLSLNDRVLVANQTNQAHNGVYKVTTVGDGSTAWVLTRTTDTDSFAPSDPDAFGKGDAFFIKEGDTNAGHLDVLSTSGTIIFGTTNIIFSEVAETTVYSAGTGLTLTGTTFSADQAIAATATPTFAGLTINGSISVTGNVDGRDVSADGTKLDGIEAGATADQTAAEIRTLVENASDSNVFTDNDHTKLNGIETGATADQTDAEIRAAVEAASDSNVFTDADHTKLNGIEANATADQTDAEIKTAYENNSDTNAFTDALLTKLNGIETSATADQSASDIEAIVSHDNLLDYVANEHIDWTTDQGSTNININNIVAASNSTSGLMASADKVKLDAIESNATADQTDAEIKTAYENNSDTNAFTDALQTKLNGIATSATANPDAIDNLVEDTSPQLGGQLDLNSQTITGTLDIDKDTDVVGYLGRAAIGHCGYSDTAAFGHLDAFDVNKNAGLMCTPTVTTLTGPDNILFKTNSENAAGGTLTCSMDKDFGLKIWYSYSLGTGVVFQGDSSLETKLTVNGTQTGNRTIYLPDASGTVALTSDITPGVSTGKAIAMAMVFG